MKKKIEAVKAAIEIAGDNRSWMVRRLWLNGFFGEDPFAWGGAARAVGLTLDEVMAARWEVRREVTP